MESLPMSNSINTHAYWKIEVLTPVHVGVGIERAWKQGTDILQKDGKVHLLNNEQLFKSLYHIGRLKHYSSQLAAGKIQECENEINKLGTAIPVLQTFTFPYRDLATDGIRPLIRNGATGRPYLPGSSIKGAVRSILFKYVKQNIRALQNATNNDAVFGGINNNIMRLFRFTDASMNRSKLMRMKIFNLKNEGGKWVGGWKHGGNTTEQFNQSGFHNDLEVFPVGAIGFMRFGVADKISNNIWQQILNGVPERVKGLPDSKIALLQNPSFNLFAVINSHTKRYLTKQITFFKKYDDAEYTADIIEKLEALKNSIPADNSYCILKLAGGSGFHSITGDWQYEQGFTQEHVGIHSGKGKSVGKHKYKSRKIAFEKVNGEWQFYPMGFVKITKHSFEEWQRLQETENQKQEAAAAQAAAEAQKQAEQLALQAAEAQRLAAEAAAEEERIREEARKPQYFKGNLRIGAEIEGIIEKVGRPNKVRVLVREGYEPVMDVSYGAGFDADKVGATVTLKIGSLRGAGEKAQLLQVTFVKFK
jgi:CRISPR/Cas system CSM-associated protein Csm5 (group 7 of RAMP superfamily)